MQTARNGEEAIDYILGASPAKYEAVITDYVMPGINGITLLERIQQIDPSLATIIATSDAERNTVSSSLKKGAVDFLEKPISRTGLLAAIVRATNHTRRQRHLIGAENRLAAVASIQKRLAPRLVAANAQERTLDCELTTRACPINEAGGDFVTALRSETGAVEVVLGDVTVRLYTDPNGDGNPSDGTLVAVSVTLTNGTEPNEAAMLLDSVPGVVDHGLFLTEADEVVVEMKDGRIERMARPAG